MILAILTMTIGAQANNAPPFEENPAQLWAAAQASGNMVYINNVAATPSVSNTTTAATALINVLMHLNKFQNPPLPWLGKEGFEALHKEIEQHLDEKFGEEEPDWEPDAVTLVFLEKAGVLVESMGINMLDDDVIEALGEADEWMTILQAAAAQNDIDDAIGVPSMGVLQSWIVDDRYLDVQDDLNSVAAAAEKFARNLIFTINTNVVGNADYAGYTTAIDNGVPVVIKIDGHFMTGVGYWQDGQDNDYIIVHDPGTSEMKVEIVDEEGVNYAYSAEYVGKTGEDIIPGCQFVKWQNVGQLDLLKLSDWQRDFEILWEEAKKEAN